MQKIIAGVILLFYCLGAFALTATETAVAKEAQIWKQAVESHDARKAAALYAPQAFLYPTFENEKGTPEGILQYFEKIFQNEDLKVVFNREHTQVYGDVGINSGIYTFSYKKNGREISVPARYTFVYIHQGNNWLIVNHHSSTLPSIKNPAVPSLDMD